MLLIFLRARPMGIHRGFFSLIMLLHIRKELLMHYQQRKCLKVFQLYSIFMELIICYAASRANWNNSKDGPRMRQGINPLTGEYQSFYFPDDHPTMPGWFKGIEQILQECGLWPESGLLADCPGPKCPPVRDNCCCRSVLFHQPDFVSQKSEL
jgi:hypothetical protein